MYVLAISGSLRHGSSNTALLAAVSAAAINPITVAVFRGLADIPPFNPDLDVIPACHSVACLRREVSHADAIIFSTPEYAHGIPGVLKNALDWLVGSGELSGKPVTLFHTSSRGIFAQAGLREVLRTMDARLILNAELTLTRPLEDVDDGKNEFKSKIDSVLQSLSRAVSQSQAIQPANLTYQVKEHG